MTQRKLFSLICALLLTAGTDSPMCKFPVAWVDRDEPAAERERRLAVVWDAVKGFPDQERRAVLAIGWGESKWARHVLRDCKSKPKDARGNCDKSKSRSYWQLQGAACPELHELPHGEGSDESVRIAAECARQHWVWSLGRCRGNVEQSFSSYGGRACGETRASTREKLDWFRRLAK